MSDHREIVLAGKKYKITVPLTLGQLIEANVGMSVPKSEKDDPVEDARRNFDRAVRVIVAALSQDHPEMDYNAVVKLRGATLREFNEAASLVFEETGLISKKNGGDGSNAGAGEAEAEAA